MEWGYRKTVNLGGVRLNFSKSGIGASIGVKGFRYGVSPAGRRYVRCGYGGISYYKGLEGPVRAPAMSASPGGMSGGRGRTAFVPPPASATLGAAVPIDSANAGAIVDTNCRDLVDEIGRRLRTPRFHVAAASMTGVAAIAALFAGYAGVATVVVIIGLIATAAAYAAYRRRRTTEIQYDLDPAYGRAYEALATSFHSVRRAQGCWAITSAAEVLSRKHHAGASSSVTREAAAPRLDVPTFLNTNVVVANVRAGAQELYLLPDVVLVIEGDRVGAVSYPELRVDARTTPFIEYDTPPRDAPQVGTTWRFVNKNGGPDRRFRDNRQLPIMQYAELDLSSTSGLRERFHLSDATAAERLVSAIALLRQAAVEGGVGRVGGRER